MGGYSIWFPDSGVVVAECFSPRKLADSTAGSELIMASWAGKAIIGFRIMHNEIFGGDLAPTVLELDASAVMDSAVMERVILMSPTSAAVAIIWQSGHSGSRPWHGETGPKDRSVAL
jgi:hypothetical protein